VIKKIRPEPDNDLDVSSFIGPDKTLQDDSEDNTINSLRKKKGQVTSF